MMSYPANACRLKNDSTLPTQCLLRALRCRYYDGCHRPQAAIREVVGNDRFRLISVIGGHCPNGSSHAHLPLKVTAPGRKPYFITVLTPAG